MESKPWNIYWFSQGQKKEHLNWMREIQFRQTSADTERIKYNTNGIKTGSSKNIDLLKSQEKTQLNPVEQQDSATLLLRSSKPLLQMRETENYCNQTWETNSVISKYWAISVLQLFVNQAVTLTLIFLIKPFRYMTKKWRQKLKYLENEKSFWGEIKSIFHHF